MENRTIPEKQGNEIHTGKKRNSESGTSEPAAIEKKLR